MPDTVLAPPPLTAPNCCSSHHKASAADVVPAPSSCCHGSSAHGAHPAPTPAAAPPGACYICPMDPEVRQAGPGACPKCWMALEPDLASVDLTPARVEYTCPMHPEVVRDAPGSCPICGMALEPRAVQAEEPDNPELTSMTRRLLASAVLGLPAFLLAMADMLLGPGLGGRVDMRLSNWIGLVVSTPVVLWAGFPFFQRGWASLVSRNLNMFTLTASA